MPGHRQAAARRGQGVDGGEVTGRGAEVRPHSTAGRRVEYRVEYGDEVVAEPGRIAYSLTVLDGAGHEIAAPAHEYRIGVIDC